MLPAHVLASPPIEVHADAAEGDLEGREVVLRGHVRVRRGRARLEGDRLRVTRTGDGGVEVNATLSSMTR